MHYLTGDRHLEQLVPSAEILIHGVHEDHTLPIDAALADAEDLYGNPLDAARALLILIAAMVPDDRSPGDLLQWHTNPHEYRRLRRAGMDAEHAAACASRVAPIRKGAVAS